MLIGPLLPTQKRASVAPSSVRLPTCPSVSIGAAHEGVGSDSGWISVLPATARYVRRWLFRRTLLPKELQSAPSSFSQDGQDHLGVRKTTMASGHLGGDLGCTLR
jgi:hypothetical protein